MPRSSEGELLDIEGEPLLGKGVRDAQEWRGLAAGKFHHAGDGNLKLVILVGPDERRQHPLSVSCTPYAFRASRWLFPPFRGAERTSQLVVPFAVVIS